MFTNRKYIIKRHDHQKSYTCEEDGGTPQNFFLAFIDELEKQIII